METGLDIVKPLETGIQVLDNLMGGGFLPGDVVLLAEEEGCPSKFLLYEIIDNLIKSERKCIYVAFDEAPVNVLRDIMLFGKNFNPYVLNKNLIFVDCFTKGITLTSGKELLEEEVKSPLSFEDLFTLTGFIVDRPYDIPKLEHVLANVFQLTGFNDKKLTVFDSISSLFFFVEKQNIFRMFFKNRRNTKIVRDNQLYIVKKEMHSKQDFTALMHIADKILNFHLIKDEKDQYATKIELYGRNLTKPLALIMEIQNNRMKLSEL